MKQLDLRGKRALVTGGSGQLGRAMVRALADCGADVTLTYTANKERAQELAADVAKEYGVKTLAADLNVSDLESAKALARETAERIGPTDILVCNAVSQYKWKHVLDQDIADYEDQFRTCVLQSVVMAKAFAPGMIARKYGRIIGINTECSMQLKPTQSAYVAGKRGMDGVYKVLAREIGANNVTVNQIAPGWTIGDSARDAAAGGAPQDDAWYLPSVPLGRRGTDEEIANAVCFLASDLASYIHGVYLPVCGGNVMPCI